MSFLVRMYQRLVETRWTIGFIDFDGDVVNPHKPLKINWIKNNPKSGWFADPFILSADENNIVLLVEELEYKKKKGRISKVVIDRATNCYTSITPVLDLPTHLSFPAWYEKDGKTFIYPESSQSGRLALYEYDADGKKTESVGNICDRPLVDAAIANVDGCEYILATLPPDENGDVLNVFRMEGGVVASEEAKIKFDDKVARNAGTIFQIGERYFRPAQQCRKSYGECVVLQELVDKQNFMFNEIKRIYSDNPDYGIGLHTFNVYRNQLIVVDARGYRWPWGSFIKTMVRKLK